MLPVHICRGARSLSSHYNLIYFLPCSSNSLSQSLGVNLFPLISSCWTPLFTLCSTNSLPSSLLITDGYIVLGCSVCFSKNFNCSMILLPSRSLASCSFDMAGNPWHLAASKRSAYYPTTSASSTAPIQRLYLPSRPISNPSADYARVALLEAQRLLPQISEILAMSMGMQVDRG